VNSVRPDELQRELLACLAISACGTADAPTLISLTEVPGAYVDDALDLLLASECVERAGMAFRITDAGRSRLNGGRT